MSSGHDDTSSSDSHKFFKFDIVGGKVTAAFELEDGVWKSRNGGARHSADPGDLQRLGSEFTCFLE